QEAELKYKAVFRLRGGNLVAQGEPQNTAADGARPYARLIHAMMGGEEHGGTRESGHHQSLRSLHPWRHEPARIPRPASRACGFHGSSSRAPAAVAKRLRATRDRVR